MGINLRKSISNPAVIAVIVVLLSFTIFSWVKGLNFAGQISLNQYLKSKDFMEELAEMTDELRQYDEQKQDEINQYTNWQYGLEKQEYIESKHEAYKWTQYYVTTGRNTYHNKVMSKFFDFGVGFYCQIDQMKSESIFYLSAKCDKNQLVQLESSNLSGNILSSYVRKLRELIEQDGQATGESVNEFEVYFFIPKGAYLQDSSIVGIQRKVNLFIFLSIQIVAVILYVVSMVIIDKVIKVEKTDKLVVPFIIRLAGYIGGVFLVRWLIINAYKQGMPWELIIERGTGLIFCASIMIVFLSCLGYELQHWLYKFEGNLIQVENERKLKHRKHSGKNVYKYLETYLKKIYEYLGIDLDYKCWLKVAQINIIHVMVLGFFIVLSKISNGYYVIFPEIIWCTVVGILLKGILDEWECFVEEFGQNTMIKKYSNQIEQIDEYKTYMWELFIGYCVILWVGNIACAIERVVIIGYVMIIALLISVYWASRKLVKMVWEIYEYANQILEHDKQGNQRIGLFKPIIGALECAEKSFNEAVQREVASERMKTELISNVSHDLKTPLTAIISYIDLLKREDLSPEEQKKYIQILDQKSQRLKILIEDLFEASKAASGNIQFALEEIDLVALLKQTLGEMSEKVGKSHLQFKVTVPEKKLMSYLDGRRTYRIFENLINNIIKYAAPYSRVYIECKEEEESVKAIFKNISEKEMNFTAEEIVERFKRGDASRHTEGSGLGLAIAKNLTELQHGVFEVYIDGDLFKVVVKFPKVEEKAKNEVSSMDMDDEAYEEYDLSEEQQRQGIGKIIKKHMKSILEEIQNERQMKNIETEEEEREDDKEDEVEYFDKGNDKGQLNINTLNIKN